MQFLNFWLDKADYYDNENMPYILYYNSFDELKKILLETDFYKVSENMQVHNKKRIQTIYKRYINIIEKNFNINIENNNKVNNKIEVFNQKPKGGFKTGYQLLRNQIGIEKYLTQELKGTETCLEIGCGGGQWSKHLYHLVKSLYCIDTLSCEDNLFWEYVDIKKKDKITYYNVKDTLLTCIIIIL